MANARIISHVVFDRNAFLPSLKLRLWSACSELAAIWSLSRVIVAVLDTSTTLWLLLLVKNTNERTVFGDPPLKRSFDLRVLTLFAISNVNTRCEWMSHFCIVGASFARALCSKTCLSGLNLGIDYDLLQKHFNISTFFEEKIIRLIVVKNAHLRE